jgi:hypothetical protein
MAKLKDVQASMGNVPGFNDGSSFTPNAGLANVAPATEGQRMYVIFRLVKKKRGRTYVDGICDNVPNPKSGKRERIWLLNGADSIWQSELTELLKDKDYVSRNRRSLIFEDGICRVPINDERALEFARATVKNVGKNRTGSGKFDFYEYDALEEQASRLKKQMTKIEVILKVKDMPADKMKKLASFLGIMPYDELGQLKGEEGIRTELLLKADAMPETVDKYFDSKEVEISYLVKKGIVEAKIDLTGQTGNALWAGGKGFICKIPANRKAHEYLTELAMTNSDEGRSFKTQLEQIVT